MNRSQGNILASPVISQNFLLFIKGVWLELTFFFELLIAEYAQASEKVVSSIGHDFSGQIKAHSLKQSLPGDLVEPVKLKNEGNEIYSSQTVLNSPVLPVQPEKVELKRKHFNAFRVSIYPISIGLQQL